MSLPYQLEWVGPLEAVEHPLNHATLIEEWKFAPERATQLREHEGSFWLSCPAVGAIHFNISSHDILAYPIDPADTRGFNQILIREWLPLVYQTWGFQVLHASAAVNVESQKVIAFAGDAGAGKSTLGYGLGRRTGWQQIADESVALQVEGGKLGLAPIPNQARLKPGSAAYYDSYTGSNELLALPAEEMRLCSVFLLEPEEAGEDQLSPASISPINGAEAYPLLLKQAYALNLKEHTSNLRLLRDYLEIATRVPACRLVYARSFSALPEILDSVEEWVRNA